jgi:hypothetical protein
LKFPGPETKRAAKVDSHDSRKEIAGARNHQAQ